VAAAPDVAKREPAALAVEMDGPDPGQFRGHPLSYSESAVRAAIVRDGDEEAERKVSDEVRVESADALREDCLLVIYGDGHLDEIPARRCGRG